MYKSRNQKWFSRIWYRKELGIEIVGDAKVRIAVDDSEDDWEEILDTKEESQIMNEIDNEVKEDFINENK